jgi:hypothetical protein
MEAWKRAPSAGFYGMRGKKVPSSNFFGMRGKKGPSGFMGMRGKKMDVMRGVVSDLSPLDSYSNVWVPVKSDGFVDGIKTYSSGNSIAGHDPSEDLLFESQSLGDIQQQVDGDSDPESNAPEHRMKRSAPSRRYQ